MSTSDADKGDGIMRQVRQTADALVDLVGQHLKLARLEFAKDLVVAAKRARTIAVLALLAVIGYALAMAGLAVFLGGNHRVGVALGAVGLIHAGVGGMGVVLAVNRMRGDRLMNVTADELKRSLTTIGSAGVSAGMEKTRAV